MMDKAVGYVRVSTKEQVDGYSLDAQEDAIYAYCDDNEFEFNKMFREEGKSASSLARPKLAELLSYCFNPANEIKYVVFFDIDRFARMLKDQTHVKAELNKRGIKIKYVKTPIEDNAAGNLVENMLGAIAQFENELKGEKVKSSIRKGLELGRWMGRAPIGYLRNPLSKTPSLLVDEERAHHIRYIFDAVDLGITTKAEILRDVTRKGFVNDSGKPLTNQAIDKMLVNPIYCGMVYSKKNDFIGKGDFEPIVSKEQFDRVNAKPGKLAGIAHTGRDAEFPLRRFVVCGKCGITITGSESKGRRKRYKYYRCKNKKCNGEKIPLIDLELQYLDELDQLSAKPVTLDLLEAIIVDTWKTKRKDVEKAQKANQRRLQVLIAKKELLNEAFIYKKSIDEDTYTEQLEKITSEMRIINSEFQDETVQEEQLNEIIVKAKSYFTNLPYCWNRLQSPVRKQFQKLIHPEGMILQDGKLGTPRKSWLFIDFVDLKTQSNTCAPPTGFEPVLPP